MRSWIGRGISGHCQVFDKPEAMGKVIDAATMLGRTTGLSILRSVTRKLPTDIPILVAQYIRLVRLDVSIHGNIKNRIHVLISVMVSTLFLILHPIFLTACVMLEHFL
jgi:hypothetical protein